MKILIKKLSPFIPILIVLFISILVALSTYKPGTILSGWDTLHPEFNLKLYSERVIWGAWQEHQGLGSAAAQAHLAELPRLPVIWILTKLFNQNDVRYIFILSMYVLGGTSTYWYIKYVWFNQLTKRSKQTSKNYIKSNSNSIAAAFGSLLYLFNLGTLQHFQVPLEMFAVHFATFGLILGAFHLFIKKGSKRFAVFLFITQIIASPAAHTSTLFYVYTSLIMGYGALYVFLNRKKSYLKRLIIAFLLILASNAYWMGPNLYYIANHSKETQKAKINRNFSDEAFWQNQAFGEINNIVIFKNFLFNWKVYDFDKQESVEMFESWDDRLKSVEFIWPYFLGLIFFSGILITFGKNKKEKLPLLVIFSLGFLFLNNLNPPSEIIYKILISISGTLAEALRFPFTKFSIVFIFACSVYLAEFTRYLFEKISDVDQKSFSKGKLSFLKINIPSDTISNQKMEKVKTIILSIIITLLFCSIVYPMKPLFEGKLISEQVKVKIPNEYFEMFSWFKSKPNNQRIAMFPILDFWQWVYYDWDSENYSNGYQGGGFMWFGLPQPLLNREFDRWATQNEYFYHEINYAVDNGDNEKLLQVLHKYNVDWLIYDKNIIDLPEKDKKYEEYYLKFNELLLKIDSINLEKSFGNINIYSVSNTEEDSLNELQLIGSMQEKVLKDVVYQNLGDYISDSSFNSNYIFSNIFSEVPQNLIDKNSNSWNIQNSTSKYDILEFPNWKETKSFLPIEINGVIKDNKIILSIKSLLPSLETSSAMIQISDFAENSQIVVTNDLEFIDDYYQVRIANIPNVLDPKLTQNQKLGTTFIKYNQNLKINLSAAYDQRNQEIIIPNNELSLLFPKQKQVSINSDSENVIISYQEPLAIDLIRKINPNQTYFEENCTKNGEVTITKNQNIRIFKSSHGGDNCQGYLINNLSLTEGYLLNFDVENVSGPNFYFLINEPDQKSFFQESFKNSELNKTFSLLPRNENNLSIAVHNRSFGSYPTINILNDIELLPIPFDYFANVIAKNTTDSSLNNSAEVINQLQPNKSNFYLLRNENKTGIILLKQSFDNGWLAITLKKPFSKLPHYKYNSWGNAWRVDQDNQTIVVFYWPQILVWLGFGLIIGSILWLMRYNLPESKISPSFNFKKIRSVFYDKKV